MRRRTNDCALFWGLPNQRPIRGSCTTSQTACDGTGILEAILSLFEHLTDRIRSSGSERTFIESLDALSLASLGEQAKNAAMSHIDRGQLQTMQLQDRLKVLQALEADRVDSATRRIVEQIDHSVTSRYDELKATLRCTFEQQPGNIGQIIEQCRENMANHDSPSSTPVHLPRLRELLNRLDALPSLKDKLTDSAFEDVKSTLTQKLNDTAERATTEVVERKAWARRLALKAELETFFIDLEGKGARLLQRIQETTTVLSDLIRRIRKQQEQMGGLTVVLPGPDPTQVVSGLKTATRCTDLADLVTWLYSSFEHRLRTNAQEDVPHIDVSATSLPDLILEVPASTLADVFHKCVTANLGRGHSLYQMVANYGVDRCLGELWKRAGPTCHLGGLASEVHGLSTIDLAILRLPLASDHGDEEIRARLKEKFTAMAAVSHIEDSSDPANGIIVTRMLAGWPIGIEQANSALADRYLRAAKAGHAMHLPGLIEDSPMGKASPGMVKLLEAHKTINDQKDRHADTK